MEKCFLCVMAIMIMILLMIMIVIVITRTRNNTIPNGTKANAAGLRLSGCACVTRMRSDEKGDVLGKRRSARRLNE